MAKTDDTIENRVYLFESLASSYVAAASELLGSEDPAVRERMLGGSKGEGEEKASDEKPSGEKASKKRK